MSGHRGAALLFPQEVKDLSESTSQTHYDSLQAYTKPTRRGNQKRNGLTACRLGLETARASPRAVEHPWARALCGAPCHWWPSPSSYSPLMRHSGAASARGFGNVCTVKVNKDVKNQCLASGSTLDHTNIYYSVRTRLIYFCLKRKKWLLATR